MWCEQECSGMRELASSRPFILPTLLVAMPTLALGAEFHLPLLPASPPSSSSSSALLSPSPP
eukprot:2722166-Rhodomonas_salina.1